MKKIHLALFCLLPLLSCSQEKNHISFSSNEKPPLRQEEFTTLKFEAEGKPCLATINNRYLNFKDKELYPLSLFITVKTLSADKNGEPTAKEAAVFNTLQTTIIRDLSKKLGNYCYVGTTTMDGYRDILLYITEKDRDNAAETLNQLKKDNVRIETYTFESDTEWEAVASFYEAIAAEN